MGPSTVPAMTSTVGQVAAKLAREVRAITEDLACAKGSEDLASPRDGVGGETFVEIVACESRIVTALGDVARLEAAGRRGDRDRCVTAALSHLATFSRLLRAAATNTTRGALPAVRLRHTAVKLAARAERARRELAAAR